jgi:hypothetical protein
MPTIFRFFWFLFAAVMAVNVVIWRRRLAIVVARGVATQVEVDRFLYWAAGWLVGGSVALGLVGLAAGWSSPSCAGFLEFDTIPRSLDSTIIIVGWLSLLLWVWRGRGADFLARVGPALGKQPSYDKTYSPAQVRAFVTFLVVVSAIGAGIGWRSVPVSPNQTCPALR